MTARVNFLSTGRWSLTYRNMVIYAVLWLLLGVVVEIGLMGQTWFARTKLATMQERSRVLQSKQQEQIQLAAAARSKVDAGSAITTLAGVFTGAPRWSMIFDALVNARPDAISLLRVVSSKEDTTSQSNKRVIDLEGNAQTPEAVEEFLERLHTQPIYREATHRSSTRDATTGLLRFLIHAPVQFTGP